MTYKNVDKIRIKKVFGHPAPALPAEMSLWMEKIAKSCLSYPPQASNFYMGNQG